MKTSSFPAFWAILPFFAFLFSASWLWSGETDSLKLTNADFRDFDASRNLPAGWNGDELTRCEPIPGGVRATLVKDHANHSSLNQMLPVKDGPLDLVLTGKITSSTDRAGYLQIKFFKNKKELRRLGSDSNGSRPTPVRIRFSTDEADAILVQCRVSTDRGVGTSAEFTDLKLEPVPPGTFMEWQMTCGKGEVEMLNPQNFAEGFRAKLDRSEAERFAPVGKDLQISQNVTFPKTSDSQIGEKAARLEFAARIEADFVQFGWLKVELFRHGELVGEFCSPKNRWCSDLCRVIFPQNGADRAVLHFVFDGRQKFHGERVRCSEIFWGPERSELPEILPPEPKLEVVPGFETASVYLHHCAAESESDLTAKLEFRKTPAAQKSDEPWQPALSPVFFPDERCLRGSLVMLEEGTNYQFRLTVKNSGHTQIYSNVFRTKSSNVRVQKTIELGPKNCPLPFTPPENGSEASGYVRYVPQPGFRIEANEKLDAAVNLNGAKFVILEGFTIRGGTRCGIQAEGAQNVRILNCDVAGFSRTGTQRVDLDGKFYLPGDDRHAANNDCGVRILHCDSILVERCFIHDPRGTANSWFYSHPAGPNAIFVGDSTSVCIRWNDFIGSDRHRWNDTIEGAANGSNWGSVRRDAEISGNYLAFGNDDGMELDGGQMNCRFCFNRTEGHLCGVSTAPCKRGPCYLYQNLFTNPGDVFGLVGVGFKNNYQNIGSGTTFFLSNTIHGYSTAFSSPGGSREEYAALERVRPFKAFARNNLAQTGSAISADFFRNLRSDFDWDLFAPSCAKELNELRKKNPEMEAHALLAEAIFRNETGGDFTLAENSPGKRAGVFVPNFMPMEAPDLGALVSGTKIAALPYRPAPFLTDVAHVDLAFDGTEKEPAFQFVEVTAQNLPEPLAFRVVQPDGAAFFAVTPNSGTLKAGESLRLKVSVQPTAITQARRNCSAFSIRTSDGLSRPVSVTVDSRSNQRLTQKDREGAVYGKVRPLEKGAVELEFDVPQDGSYWLFAFGTHENCQWKSAALDGGDVMERIALAPRGSSSCWRNVSASVFSGGANRPFPLKAGRHVFRLEPKSGRPLKPSQAALCEDPDAFRLNP